MGSGRLSPAGSGIRARVPPSIPPCASKTASLTLGGASVPLPAAVISAPPCRASARRNTSRPPSAEASMLSASSATSCSLALSAVMRRLTSMRDSLSPAASHGSSSSRANSRPRPRTGRSPQRQVAVPATRLPSRLSAMSLKAACRSSSTRRIEPEAWASGATPAGRFKPPKAARVSGARRVSKRSAHSDASAVPAPEALMVPSPGSSAEASGTIIRPFSRCTVRRSRRSATPRKLAASAERSRPNGNSGLPPRRSASVQASRSRREASSAASSLAPGAAPRGASGRGSAARRREIPPRACCPPISRTNWSTPTTSAVAVSRPVAVKAPRGVGSSAERSCPAASSRPSKPPSASSAPRAAILLPEIWPAMSSGAAPSSPARPSVALKASG